MKISIISKITHFPLRGKVGQLRKKKRVLGWSIYSISLCSSAWHKKYDTVAASSSSTVLYCEKKSPNTLS